MKKKWDPGCGEFRSGLRLCVCERVWFSEFFWGALVESNLLCIFDCWLDHVDYFVLPECLQQPVLCMHIQMCP